MLTLKELWNAKIPYNDNYQAPNYKREINFVKTHAPIFLAGLRSVLKFNMRWGIIIGMAAFNSIPRSLPKPDPTPSDQNPYMEDPMNSFDPDYRIDQQHEIDQVEEGMNRRQPWE